MATDITIGEASGAEPKTFETFAHDELPMLARAVAAVADHEAHAIAAVAAATQEIHDRWAVIDDAPEREFYAAGVRHLQEIADGANSGEGTLRAASIVAFYGLDWPLGDIASTLGLPPEDVAAVVEQAADAHPTDRDDDLRSHIKEQIAAAQANLPDTKAWYEDRAANRQRKRRAIAGVVAVVLIAVLALLGQFGSQRERAEPSPIPTVAAPAATTPRPPQLTSPPPAGTVEALDSAALDPATTESPTESTNPLVTAVAPDLIVDDGRGGFAGVRGGGEEGPAAVIVTSQTGSDWAVIGGLNFGPSVSAHRFDRSGDQFVVWLDGLATANDSVIETVAVTADFRQWDFLQLAIDAPAPRGLEYEFEVTDIALRNNTILALVTMKVELDFPALQLVESNTCGHSIETEAVIVKLCNGGEIDVLSVAGIDQLPLQTRLFTGTDGFRLTETTTPFLRDATALASTADAAMLTDDSGKWLASSADGQTWQRPTLVWPPGVITAAATDNNGNVVSLIRDDELVLHTSRGNDSFSQPFVGLLPDLTEQDSFDVAMAGTDGAWVMYVSNANDAWLVTSLDGATWQTRPVARLGSGQPTLFVGANQVIIQWRGGTTNTMIEELG